ncbi:MAG: hypothetical protein KZQ80_12000 [Candidatus Thiodiazotropha sp. (ex Monitilora ramsayi)]|nr:hypothetical protein [Candidatus Thiodiazotropha sp. (ex Monitilora ramsayi)]
MDDAIQIPRYHFPPTGRYGFAFLFSVCLHAVILWLVARYLLKTEDVVAPPPTKTIHLQLSPAVVKQPESTEEQRPQTPSLPHNPQTSDRNTEPPSTEALSTTARQPPPAAENPPLNSARILATARDLAHQMAANDKTQPEQPHTPIQSALEKALNPKREPPGVRTLADGTIRVVTEFGLVYCIRPRDDSRILGPEDDLPISVTCR